MSEGDTLVTLDVSRRVAAVRALRRPAPENRGRLVVVRRKGAGRGCSPRWRSGWLLGGPFACSSSAPLAAAGGRLHGW